MTSTSQVLWLLQVWIYIGTIHSFHKNAFLKGNQLFDFYIKHYQQLYSFGSAVVQTTKQKLHHWVCSQITLWDCTLCVFAAVCACASARLPQYMCGCQKTSRGQSSTLVAFPNWPSSFHRFPSCCRSTCLTDAHNWVQLSASSRVLNSGPHTCSVNT